MPKFQIELDQDHYEHLVELAGEHRRPIPWQAEHMLIRMLDKKRRRDELEDTSDDYPTTGARS